MAGKRIVILAALGLELKPLARALQARRDDQSGLRLSRAERGGSEVFLAGTGVGPRAGPGADRVFHVLAPDAALSTGTAGGLRNDLPTGRGVVAERVLRLDEGDGLEEVAADPGLVEAARRATYPQAPYPPLFAPALTVAAAQHRPEAKQTLGEDTGAAACEMESFHVAQRAGARGVPFLTVRTVSDTCRDRLPDFGRFSTDEGVDSVKMGEYFALHPDEARRFAAFLRLTRRAAAAIPHYILPLLDAL